MCLTHDRVRASTVDGVDDKGVPLAKGVSLVDDDEPDDNEMPHRYKACEVLASACTARTG